MRAALSPAADGLGLGEAFRSALAPTGGARRRRHSPLDRTDVVPAELYGLVRSRYLPLVRRILRRRRVWLGDDVSVQFESRVTAVYHLHEALRADGTWTARDVARALAEHEVLVPRPGQLVATFMVHGGAHAAEICSALACAPQKALQLRTGARSVGARAVDESNPRYPVHFLAFDLTAADRRNLSQPGAGAALTLAIGSATTRERTVSLPFATQRALLSDVEGE